MPATRGDTISGVFRWALGRANCLVVLSLVACVVSACRDTTPGGPQTRTPKDWNVFVITIDTLRADRLPSYGAAGVATPAIARLAAEGTTFEWAFTPVPLTLPAHASIFTGTHPFRHGVRNNGGFYLDSQQRTLASTLKERGYRTAAFVSAFVLDSQWGLATGFDHYYDDFELSAGDVSAMARVQRPGEQTWAAAERWLDERGGERFLAWLHLFDPHTPYEPPQPFRSQYAGRPYDAEIAYSDSIVGRAIDWLRARNLLEKTVVVLLSDHGEGLGDHDEDEHGLLAYDSTLRVPWIIRFPEQSHRGGRIAQSVSLVDVTPTILGLLGISVPASLDGVDMSPQIASGSTVAVPPIYAETYYPRLQFNWSELVSVRDDRYKFIRAPRPELYEYRSDQRESRNLVTERAEVAARFGRILDNMRRQSDALPVAKPIDAEAERRLSSLGYVAGSSPTQGPIAVLPDPKDRVDTYRKLSRARELLAVGDKGAGVEILEAIVLEEPELAPARELLRNYFYQPTQVRRGLEWFAAATRKRPDSVPLLVELGTFQRAVGHLDESTATLQKALEHAPNSVEALSAAAETHRAAGRLDRAVDVFKKAATLTNDPTPTMRVAETLTRVGRPGEAEDIVKRTLTEHPKLGGAHYLLGFIAEQRGDFAAAEREYRTEMSLTPWDHRPVFNLALLIGQRGDFPTELQLLESIPKIAPDFADVDFYLAKTILDLGDRARFPEAVAAARRGLQRAPNSPQAPLGHYVLADIFMLEGKKTEAARELRLGKALEDRVGPPRGGPLTTR